MDNDFTTGEVSRGKRILESPLLTDDGRRWLLRAVDPFHDTQVRPAGYPDFDQSGTVVQEVNMSLNIAVPSGVTSGANWDCHIFNMADFACGSTSALLNAVTYAPTTGALGLGTATYWPAGLAFIAGAAGVQMLPDGTSPTVGSIAVGGINPVQYLTSKARVVGWAFEVVNTTAELYKQGTITAYRLPQIDNRVAVNAQSQNSGGQTCYSMTPFRTFALPPSTVAEALVLPASKQWDAARGYYGVCTLMNNENIMQSVDSTGRIYLAQSWANGTNPIAGIVSSYLIGSTSVFPNSYHAPYNTCGAYFTGLSYQTTLQVNMKLLLEAAPGPRSPLVTLAQPSPSYDPEALRLYSQLCGHLPVAVPVDENPDGEWFQSILGTLGSLSTMASGINPMFGIVGTGLTLASKVVPQFVDAFGNKERSKPKKRPSQADEDDSAARLKRNLAKTTAVKRNVKPQVSNRIKARR